MAVKARLCCVEYRECRLQSIPRREELGKRRKQAAQAKEQQSLNHGECTKQHATVGTSALVGRRVAGAPGTQDRSGEYTRNHTNVGR